MPSQPARSVKPFLNWRNLCFANLVRGVRRTGKKFGKVSSFLIGRTFTSRTFFGQFDERRWSYARVPKRFALGIFTQFGEPCLWLAESKESSPVGEEEIKIKMDEGVDTSLTSEGTDLVLICGRRSLVSGTQNGVVVSWITLWWMVKVYWLEMTWGCTSGGVYVHCIYRHARWELP